MLLRVYISTRISIRCAKYLKLRQNAWFSPPETEEVTGNPASGSVEQWAGAGNHSDNEIARNLANGWSTRV